MSVTTSAVFNQDQFEARLPAGTTYGWTGPPFETTGEKVVTATCTDQELQAAVTAAAASFIDHRARIEIARTNLVQAYPTIRQWATDAATANTNWPTMTAAQKDATTRETIRRLGVFLDRFGDLLQITNGDL